MTVSRRAWLKRSGAVLTQKNSEDRASPGGAFDLEKPAMMIEDMFDDGQAEPGAAQLAGARGVDPVEPFGQSGQVLARDALAVIAHSYRYKWDRANITVVRKPQHGLGTDLDLGPGTTVFYRVVQEVLKNLSEFVAVPQYIGESGRQGQQDAHAAFARAKFQRLGDAVEQRT